MTLVDDRMVIEDAVHANFLITPEEAKHAGKCLAEVYCNSLREFNPMVHVSVEKGLYNVNQLTFSMFSFFLLEYLLIHVS